VTQDFDHHSLRRLTKPPTFYDYRSSGLCVSTIELHFQHTILTRYFCLLLSAATSLCNASLESFPNILGLGRRHGCKIRRYSDNQQTQTASTMRMCALPEQLFLHNSARRQLFHLFGRAHRCLSEKCSVWILCRYPEEPGISFTDNRATWRLDLGLMAKTYLT